MRVLRAHNRYRDRGGEDAVFEAEVDLLKSRGHFVETLTLENNQIANSPDLLLKSRLALTTIWSRQGRQLVSEAMSRYNPDIVHFDNTMPLISPAAYSVARANGAAVVQTLHNYRLMCPNGMLFRNGGPCEDCIGKRLPVPGVVHSCYRDSRSQSAVVATMIASHHLLGTWRRHVDRYIVLTEFARGKFIEGGFPAERLMVKPNFVSSPDNQADHLGSHFLFVGRLSPEKGIETLMRAQPLHDQPLRVVGEGPLMREVMYAAKMHLGVYPIGRLNRRAVQEEMSQARALILPSIWYEGFPVTIIEAFASGLPVIASRLGSMSEIIRDGLTGLLFNHDEPEDLARKVKWAASHPEEMRVMGTNARREYEARYTPERNYDQLIRIYDAAIGTRANGVAHSVLKDGE